MVEQKDEEEKRLILTGAVSKKQDIGHSGIDDMATFTDFEIWYHGKAPLGIMSIVRNEMTYSGLLTVGIAERDSINI